MQKILENRSQRQHAELGALGDRGSSRTTHRKFENEALSRTGAGKARDEDQKAFAVEGYHGDADAEQQTRQLRPTIDVCFASPSSPLLLWRYTALRLLRCLLLSLSHFPQFYVALYVLFSFDVLPLHALNRFSVGIRASDFSSELGAQLTRKLARTFPPS